jgi:Ohr subfamily peroxiredoxin
VDILYSTEATSIGGRDGSVKSADGLLDLQLALPKEMGGPGGKPNPEELFAAGYAACFHSALKMVAGLEKLSVHNSTVTAQVGLGKNAAGGFGLEVGLVVALPSVPVDVAEKLVRKAHEVCPYSNATRGNVDVHLALATPGEAPIPVA